MSFSPGYQQRFGGIIRLYGTQAATALLNSHVLIVGIGGVGSWTAEALARSGIGEITLLDLDDICTTNTNRQVHALQTTVGHSKVHTMGERLQAINPELKLNLVEDFLDQDNISEYVDGRYQMVIDAIDSSYTKAALIAYCKRRKIKIITIGSAGGKKDPGQIIYGDLSKTTQDPLLAKVRNSLRRLHHFSRNPKRVFSIEAIYSTEGMTYPDDQGETCQSRAFLGEGEKLDCSGGYGAATMVTATFGFMAASRAIQKISQAKRNSPPPFVT